MRVKRNCNPAKVINLIKHLKNIELRFLNHLSLMPENRFLVIILKIEPTALNHKIPFLNIFSGLKDNASRNL